MVDVVDNKTLEKTGEIISKDRAHMEGIWHSAIHIIMISKDKKRVLLQKRCPSKKLYPNMWDITVGGHISAGEEAIDSAKREFLEELGLNFDDFEYEFLDKVREEFYDNGLSSREVVYVYLVFGDVEENFLKLQEEEVSAAKWFNRSEFLKLVADGKIIKHDVEFKVIKDLLR